VGGSIQTRPRHTTKKSTPKRKNSSVGPSPSHTSGRKNSAGVLEKANGRQRSGTAISAIETTNTSFFGFVRGLISNRRWRMVGLRKPPAIYCQCGWFGGLSETLFHARPVAGFSFALSITSLPRWWPIPKLIHTSCYLWAIHTGTPPKTLLVLYRVSLCITVYAFSRTVR
jgi:hypothetical protein